MYSLPTTLADDIKNYSSIIDEFLDNKLEPVKFKAIRVPMGIYEQREDGTFMVRVRCAGGFIAPKQLMRVAEISDQYGSGLLHITTRQELQIQTVTISQSLTILQNLKEIGLSSKGGGGNTVRNILSSIDSGICDDEQFDVTPYAFDLTTKLIAESDSFTLPRKFKIAFSNSDEDTGFAKFNDLGFIATQKDGKRGFKVFLGGSLGSKPMIGHQIFDFAPEEELYYIADAAKKLFSRYGNRKNKHKARLRYIFYKLGNEEVTRLFFEIYDEIKTDAKLLYTRNGYTFEYKNSTVSTPLSEKQAGFDIWKKRYAKSQTQKGFYTIIVPFHNGNSSWETLFEIARFAEQFGNDTIRFSMRQNLHLRNIPESSLGNLYSLLLVLNLEVAKPLLLNTLVACTGADTCRLGLCLSKGAAGALKDQLDKSGLPLDKLPDFRINISGCPNSCGQQTASDLGFFGKVGRNSRMYPAYYVVAGASIGPNPKLAKIIGEVSAYDLPRYTTDVLDLYLRKKDAYHSFGDFCKNEGNIALINNKYSQIPDFKDDKNYYFDWGSDHIFSLAAKGVGECSAGLFDMIEVDLNNLQKLTASINSPTSDKNINNVLYEIIFSSSRMLLITRGCEPKNKNEVFEGFLHNFINTHIVSSVFREIVEIARDNQNYNFALKKDTILELSQAVISLYQNMDDSLQFKNLENTVSNEPSKPVQSFVKSKDLRGVACPMNFVKTKVELATLKIGAILEIYLDDGEPIENVPGSIRSEGHTILHEVKTDNYWKVTIKKGV